MKRWAFLALLLAVGLLAACKAGEKGQGEEGKPATLEPYKIGVMADITGTQAVQYAPVYEGFRNYFQNLNAKGGIDGHPVELTLEDNRSLPELAITATKKFSEGGAILIADIALSATLSPGITEAEKTGMPFLVGTSCMFPQNYPPNPLPNAFCVGWAGVQYSGGAPVVIKELTKEGPAPKVALLGVDSPVGRAATDAAERTAKAVGLEVVTRADVPPGTTDFTAYADKFIAAKADWLQAGAPVGITFPTYEALVRRGWKGNYILDFVVGCGDAILEKYKREDLMAFCMHTRLAEGLPVFKEIKAAVDKYGATYPIDEFGIVWGWNNGMMVEHLLRQCGWPCTREKALATANNLEFPKEIFKGLQPGPIKWTPQDHAGVRYMRLDRWDSAKGKIVPISKWWRMEARPGELVPLD